MALLTRGTDPAGVRVLVTVQQRHASGVRSAPHLRAAGSSLLLAHLLVVAWLALRPLDVPWVSPGNFTPLAGIKADLALGHGYAIRSIGKDLVMLAPLGVLLPLAHGRLHVSPLASFARTVAAGAFLSLAVELLQTGVPGRVTDVDSLFLNTIGVALAHLVVVPAVRTRLRRRFPAAPAPRPSAHRPEDRALAGARVGLVP